MREGFLSRYFEAVAAKRLSPVEADTSVSNQHEFNGTRPLKRVLGTVSWEKVQFSTRFIWLGDTSEPVVSDGFVTWYDSRINTPHRSPEFRLYFQSTDVTNKATPGDMLFIARRTDNTIMIIITSQGSTIENQLLWLFGLPSDTGNTFSLQDVSYGGDREVGFASRFILEELGLEVEEPQGDYLDSLLERFQGNFPSTRDFSLLARETVNNVSPMEEPDQTLVKWLEHEENLFRRLERKIVSQRLESGFVLPDGSMDVDSFISFSLGVQNRRKSRAGLALENHLEALFSTHRISYSRTTITENRNKPDFLFPGGEAYHNLTFPVGSLTMLGVKTSCKDRWRQVLPEANRIPNKHLFTLEPGISENQTDEMQAHSLQLVLPVSIHESYRESQRQWLMSLADFISLVRARSSQR